MTIQVALRHRTSYTYDRLVSLGPQVVRLRPAPHCRTRVLSYALHVDPGEHFVNWQQDPQANYLARLVFPKQTNHLVIDVELLVEIVAQNPFDFFLEPEATDYPFDYEKALRVDLAPYFVTGEDTPLLLALVASIPREKRRTIDFLVAVNQKVQELIRYVVRLEPGLQTPEQTLSLASGSCRDSGWLLVQMFRRLGLAARFVSGYLVQLKPDEKPVQGPPGPERDFIDLHAWCEVYLPGAGWVGLDPTSGLLAGEGHLPLACTAEPSAAAPVSGLIDPCETTFVHEMSVTRVLEAPRVTLPYTDDEWKVIHELGARIDGELLEADVRLTMGGEPTFVAASDMDADEWNTEALGPTKKALATSLFWKLRDQYAPKGLVHFGQGKWYPGEQLPRWALNLYWRKDGEPLFSEQSLYADESRPDPGITHETAGRFLRRVAERLSVSAGFVLPAWEDVYYYLWREHRLPVNVDVLDAKLDDPLERERLRRVFSAGLGNVVGYALPIAREPGGAAWRSGPWHLRGERCHLSPGDSPMGFRLPLDGQPWAKPEDRETQVAVDPSVALPPLPRRIVDQRVVPLTTAPAQVPDAAQPTAAPGRGESAPLVVRTAMCVEPRNGVLFVFMPPVSSLEDYVDLVSAVEQTARELSQPISFEGYPPPKDHRLGHLSVTPDPGVIEVNIHPSSRWQELVDRTTHLYAAARELGLATDKFMVDGRHVGTGGGNHFVLGGATPDDSPFLRRPDLLAGFLMTFQRHPSLSYLFSGLFIGPTSQAPRTDEARNDALHELEIALGEVTRNTKKHGATPPWLVDRIFRDVLTDATGNTHRTEMCIDKLFSPDGAAGRLGLLEMRSFEMPPHARMSLVQQLLLRALVMKLWREPLPTQRLPRWGTELHDRFMLPHFVWQDLCDVLEELRVSGFPLEPAWFLPHFEFRFPKLGDVRAAGIDLELRTALEPWNVTGEDAASGGTARYVDSSLERLEVKVTGLTGDRWVVTCNGHALPLAPTQRNEEYVAGVRFRAWQPPRCLHPTIGVQAPLTFDVVDTWSGRSVGGCQYHVSHPGGRSHDTRPINALEAEGRRRARFFRIGHTPGTLAVAPPVRSLEFPYTLDLRTV
jgi:uncharacterized protein (DUF2126 family)/transglutaminase-like putative cysteine protease